MAGHLRRPENPIGWLYGAAGLAWAYTVPLEPWVDRLIREHRARPFAAKVLVATGSLGWAPAIALITVAGTFVPGPLEERGIDSPFGLAGPAGSVAATLTVAGVLLHWWSLPPAALCAVLRFRSSRGVERQQMRWVAAGVAAAVPGWSWPCRAGSGSRPAGPRGSSTRRC